MKTLWKRLCRRPAAVLYDLGAAGLVLYMLANFALDSILYTAGVLREQTVTGPPQIRQVRGSGRDSLLPSVSSTSRSYSRPMGAAVSSVRQAAFSSAAGRS